MPTLRQYHADIEPQLTDDEPILTTGLSDDDRDIARRQYAAKQQARIDRLAKRAEKHEAASDAAWQSAHGIMDQIPFGQPILVGHHSEKHHRRDAAKIDSRMRKCVEEANTAKALRARLEAAEKNTAINSDDPDAILHLKAKLEKMEAFHALMVGVNKFVKKKGVTDEERAALLKEGYGLKDATITALLTPDCLGRTGFADYQLQNHSADMRRLKKRIAEIDARDAMQPTDQIFGDIRVWEDVIDNRVKIEFPGKPNDAVRSTLRHAGFVWSPTNSAWQRKRTPVALREALRCVRFANGEPEPPFADAGMYGE